MRLYHWIGLEKDSTDIYIFDFLNFTFEYLKRLQSSEPLHTKMTTSCLYGSRYVENPFLLLAAALLFDETILHYFGLDCGMLGFF
jgi:hypothetical protein